MIFIIIINFVFSGSEYHDGRLRRERRAHVLRPQRRGQGQVWRWGPGGGSPEGKSGDTAFGLPVDTFWMLGHDAQSVAIVPSKQIVVVRLGLTPSHLNYKPQALLAAVIKAVDAEAGK